MQNFMMIQFTFVAISISLAAISAEGSVFCKNDTDCFGTCLWEVKVGQPKSPPISFSKDHNGICSNWVDYILADGTDGVWALREYSLFSSWDSGIRRSIPEPLKRALTFLRQKISIIAVSQAGMKTKGVTFNKEQLLQQTKLSEQEERERQAYLDTICTKGVCALAISAMKRQETELETIVDDIGVRRRIGMSTELLEARRALIEASIKRSGQQIKVAAAESQGKKLDVNYVGEVGGSRKGSGGWR
eukprot:GHVS01079821.1.p1 GENE.GHVS01079821.1~~GHVS01079821.1.p1  ORF type:complete len:246 (-),score=32.56 GHVS01079821.1:557-1294(-)